MRRVLPIAVIGGLLPLLATAQVSAPSAGPSIPDLLRAGHDAMMSGDYDGAKDDFNQILAIDPSNNLAIQSLRIIRSRQVGLPGDTTKNPINDLIIPNIQFKDATFSAALDFLKQKAADQQVAVSFVSELPPTQMEHTVSLNLTSVPFLEALRYLCDLNGSLYKMDRYAIVIVPLPSAPSPIPPAQ